MHACFVTRNNQSKHASCAPRPFGAIVRRSGVPGRRNSHAFCRQFPRRTGCRCLCDRTSVHMCVYIYIYMCMHIDIYIYIYIYIYIDIYEYINLYIYIDLYIYIYIIYRYLSIYTYISLSIYISLYMVWLYISTCIYTYIDPSLSTSYSGCMRKGHPRA